MRDSHPPAERTIIATCMVLAVSASLASAAPECVNYEEYLHWEARIELPARTSPGALALAGGYAYLADSESHLVIVDVTNPEAPSIASRMPIPGHAQDLAVAGDHAYVASRETGLQIVDVSDPRSPVVVGSLDTPDWALGVALDNGRAYVTDREAGVFVVDVSVPASPVLLGSYDTPDLTGGIAVRGARAYVAAFFGLLVVDVADPSRPRTLRGIETPAEPEDVAAAGDHAYVACGPAGLQIVDVTVPEAPVIVGSAGADWATDIALQSNYAYVADYGRGLLVADISDPSSPVIVAQAVSGGVGGTAVAAGATQAYVADLEGGLLVLDATNPQSVPPLGEVEVRWPSSTAVNGMAAEGDHVYLAHGFDFWAEGGFSIIDITDPTAPAHLGGIVFSYTDISATSVAPAGDVVYLGTSWGLDAIDVTDPVHPWTMGAVYDGLVNDVAAAGPLAYAAFAELGVRIFDFIAPSNPVMLGSVETLGEARGLAAAGDLLLVADGPGGLQVVDVSDPTSPSIIASVTTGGNARDVQAFQSFACVTDSAAGFLVFDLSDPASPHLLATVPALNASILAVAEPFAFVADGASGLLIIDISVPEAPSINSNWGPPAPLTALATGGLRPVVAPREHGSILVLPEPCRVEAVVLSSFSAVSEGNAILVRWHTSSEHNHLGFRLHRAIASPGASYALLTPDWIRPPSPYAYRDASVEPGVTYFYRLEALDRAGGRETFGPVAARLESEAPPRAADSLGDCRPNPFRPSDGVTAIDLTLGRSDDARLHLYDPAGRMVRRLVAGHLPAGSHTVFWDGRNDRGMPAPPGVYFLRLETGEVTATRPVLLIP